MRDERGGIVGRLLFLALLGWGGWFFVTRWWPQHNLQTLGGRLESAIDQELTRQGITDRDVVSQVRKEHSLYGLTWIETQRTLRLGDPARAGEVSQGLAHTAARLGCSFEKQQTSGGLDIRIKRFFWLLQRIALRTAGEIEKRPNGKNPRVAFVIDDVGYATAPMDRFAALGVPLTFAILPRERHSTQLARKATALNFPVMLHLPMEPLDMVHNDPGPAGLYLKMSDRELKSQFDKDVASVPNIVGVNNHMGSAFTEDAPKMALVLEWVKKKGFYFLDSHTSGRSIVSKVARRVGVPCLTNETFLDNQDDVKSIEKQLDLVLDLAVKRGQTIAIGHYRRKYLVQALADKLPEFKARGVEIVPLPAFYR